VEPDYLAQHLQGDAPLSGAGRRATGGGLERRLTRAGRHGTISPVSIPSAAAFELLRPDLPRGRFRAAVFDFDGTLSLLREGWPRVMTALMREAAERAGVGGANV